MNKKPACWGSTYRKMIIIQIDSFVNSLLRKKPGLTLLLASWLSWQDLAKLLLHLGNHGSHGKILIKILLR